MRIGRTRHVIYFAVTGVQGVVSDNTLNSTTSGQGTGINAGSNSRVRIEGNHVSGFNVGIQATSSKALVVRISARAKNTNFSIRAKMTVVTPAMLGTNPNANISQ